MELKTQALDRLLEALSPALSAEFDRVVRETSERLEEEFQMRLQAAVRDAESATRTVADAELRRAVDDAIEATRRNVSEDLERQFKSTLADTTAQLEREASGQLAELELQFSTQRTQLEQQASAQRAQLEQQASAQLAHLHEEATAEHTRLQAELDRWRFFAETQRQLAEASSQREILVRFLRLAQPFADGLAVYTTKADGLALWKSRGKGVFPEIISKETTDPESFFRTITVRGKTVAAICAAPPFKADALDFLGTSLERAIEVYGLKLRAPLPSVPSAPNLPKPAVSETTVAVGSSPSTGPSVPPAAAELGPDDQKAHAEARRTARMLVSEIKLYHEQELESGRQHRDIYQRLQKEIDLAREMYSHRVSGEVQAAHDYFHEELVRILGENDASRLGVAYPGPRNSSH